MDGKIVLITGANSGVGLAALEHQRDAMWVGLDGICLIEPSQAIGDAL